MADVYTVPSGGQAVVVDGKHLYVRYQVGDTWVYYHVADPRQINEFQLGVEFAQPVSISSSAPEFQQRVEGGNISELASFEQQQNYAQHIEKQINILSGGNTIYAQDPEIRAILLDAAVNPDISQAEIEARVKQTNYYKSRTQAQLEWDRLSEAERQARISKASAELVRLWFTNVGAEIDITDPRILQWGTLIASGQKSAGEALEELIKPEAEKNPESPWSREVRKATEDQRQRGVDIENTGALVRDLAMRWGVPMSDEWVTKWATQLTSKVKSQADLEEYLKKQAQILYPWKDPSVETASAAEPYMQSYARILEKGVPGMDNKLIQKALQSGMPLFEFEKELRRQPDWMTTKNAQDELIASFGQVSRTMGFA